MDSKDILSGDLSSFSISTGNWGKDGSKTFLDLKREVNEGECTLEIRGGKLLRVLNVVTLNINYQDSLTKEKFRLIEEVQVLSDGSEKHRKRESSIARKIKKGEIHVDAARRALEEETGMTFQNSISIFEGVEERNANSQNYPGLKTLYKITRFELRIFEDQYSPDGYVRENQGITTRFMWEKVSSSQTS